MDANEIAWALSICAAHVGDPSELAGMIEREPIPIRFRVEVAELLMRPPQRWTPSKATLNQLQVTYIRHMHRMLLKHIVPSASESTSEQVRGMLARSLKCSPDLIRDTVEAKRPRTSKHRLRKRRFQKPLATCQGIEETKMAKRLQARKDFHNRQAASSSNGV